MNLLKNLFSNKPKDNQVSTLKENAKQIVANRAFILKLFNETPATPMSADDIATEYSLNRVHVSCRLSELLRDGLICPVDFEKKNKSYYTKYILTPENLIQKFKDHQLKEDLKVWLKKSNKFKDLLTQGTLSCIQYEIDKLKNK